jgi:hypothetical protein
MNQNNLSGALRIKEQIESGLPGGAQDKILRLIGLYHYPSTSSFFEK